MRLVKVIVIGLPLLFGFYLWSQGGITLPSFNVGTLAIGSYVVPWKEILWAAAGLLALIVAIKLVRRYVPWGVVGSIKGDNFFGKWLAASGVVLLLLAIAALMRPELLTQYSIIGYNVLAGLVVGLGFAAAFAAYPGTKRLAKPIAVLILLLVALSLFQAGVVTKDQLSTGASNTGWVLRQMFGLNGSTQSGRTAQSFKMYFHKGGESHAFESNDWFKPATWSVGVGDYITYTHNIPGLWVCTAFTLPHGMAIRRTDGNNLGHTYQVTRGQGEVTVTHIASDHQTVINGRCKKTPNVS